MISYLIKVSFCWAFSYLGYTLLLRPTTFFQLNRLYLLGTFLLSLLIPFLPWPDLFLFGAAESPAVYMLPVVSTAPEEIAVFIQATAPETPFWLRTLLAFYLLGTAVYLFRLGLGLLRLYWWRIEGRKENYPEYCLVHTLKTAQPFSFFRWLYWPEHLETESRESRQMLAHEAAHIRQWHSLDLFLVEMVSALLWFHPLPRLYGHALRNVHEYLADAVVLRQGSRKAYGHLLIRQALLGSPLPLIHNFSPAQLKKRIQMMTKHKTRPEALLRYVLLLPLPLLMGAWFARQPVAMGTTDPDPVVLRDSLPSSVEVMPQFYSVECQGVQDAKDKEKCAMNALIQHLSKNLKYPEYARKEKIQGTVVVSFVVDENGLPTEAKVVKDVGGGCGTEALRVVESTRWIPARDKGKVVKAEMKLPVSFRLAPEAEKGAASPQAIAPTNSEKEEVFMVVEEMPLFPGCEGITDKEELKKCSNQKLFEFIGRTLKYPEQARKDKIEGMAIIEFIIDKTGTVRDAKIIKDVDGGCGQEALRVVNLLPSWVPGKQRGSLVSVSMRLPFQFKLQAQVPASEAAPSGSDKPLSLSELKNFRLSPNPSDGEFELRFQPDPGNVSVKIFNQFGQELESHQVNDAQGLFQKSFNLSKQPKGTYLILVKQGEKGYTGTIVIQ